MDVVRIVDTVLEDLSLVATSGPNERLPKEEQVRCCIYAAIRPLFRVVCAERGYGSIDDRSRTECDLWAFSPGQVPVWLRIQAVLVGVRVGQQAARATRVLGGRPRQAAGRSGRVGTVLSSGRILRLRPALGGRVSTQRGGSQHPRVPRPATRSPRLSGVWVAGGRRHQLGWRVGVALGRGHPGRVARGRTRRCSGRRVTGWSSGPAGGFRRR